LSERLLLYQDGTQRNATMVAIYNLRVTHPVVGWRRDHLRSSIMTGISERQSLTREEKFVALVHLYVELRLPFDAALDAAEADLLHEQNKDPRETNTTVRDEP
jgi:hypothetical protein